MSYAPILLVVYTRLDNLKNLVESLKINPESTSTDLYILSDAASNESDIKLVDDVRHYSDNIIGFKSVNVMKPDLNSRKYGIDHNSKLKSELFDIYGKLIFLEDDNVVSKHFLRFMNEAMEFYKDDPNVGCICGYKAPFEIPSEYDNDVYLGLRYSPWGYGILKKWYDTIDWTSFDRYSVAIKKENRKNFKLLGSDFLNILERDSLGEIDAADARVVYHQVMNGLYSVFPTRSLVRNVGFDGTGEHCGKTDRYYVELNEDDEYSIQLESDLKPDMRILKSFCKFMNYKPVSTKIRDGIKFLPKLILRKLGLLNKVRSLIRK